MSTTSAPKGAQSRARNASNPRGDALPIGGEAGSDTSAGSDAEAGSETAPAAGGDAAVTAERVAVTDAAREVLRELWLEHGPLMFHQSGGCCDGSSPMCFPDGEFWTSDADVYLADLSLGAITEGDAVRENAIVPFWMSVEQYDLWRHTHLTVDVVPGRGSGFSLEAPRGVRFLIRSRLMARG